MSKTDVEMFTDIKMFSCIPNRNFSVTDQCMEMLSYTGGER